MILLSGASLLLWTQSAFAFPARHAATDEGIILFQQTQYKKALEKFIAAYEANEDPPVDCFQQALCYYKLGDQARARQMFKFVVDNFPSSSAAQSANQWLADAALWNAAAPSSPANLLNAASSLGNTKNGSAAIVPKCVVPYMTDQSNMILVQVMINGKPIPAYFDTGAEVSFFTTSQLLRAGIQLQTSSAGKARLGGIGGETQASIVEVDMQMGGLAKHMKIFVQDDASMIRNIGERSVVNLPLIGEDLYGGLTFSIDDRLHTITFYPDGISGRDPDAVPYYNQGKLIIVKPKINGRECEMILDTGAAIVSFSDLQLSSAGMSRPTNAGRAGSVGIGGMRQSYVFEVDSISLGAIEKRHVQASCDIFGSGPKPLLGRTFLKGLKLTIDPKAHLLHLEQ